VIEPCLLHGDLWSGNISSDKNGEPVILDPACYCKSKIVQIYCARTNHFEN
jgi:fructosamine-3-kinase